jgi:hypothetical protein
VLVDPAPGATIPYGLKIEIGVRPESGRMPEVVYRTGGQVEYTTAVQFDRDDYWRVRLALESEQCSSQAFFPGGGDSSRFRALGP